MLDRRRVIQGGLAAAGSFAAPTALAVIAMLIHVFVKARRRARLVVVGKNVKQVF